MIQQIISKKKKILFTWTWLATDYVTQMCWSVDHHGAARSQELSHHYLHSLLTPCSSTA